MAAAVLSVATAALIAGGPRAHAHHLTDAEIQQLGRGVHELERAIEIVSARDAAVARPLEQALEVLRDEVTYLRVMLRRTGVVSHEEYDDIRRQLDRLRARVSGEHAGLTTENRLIPAGTEMMYACSPR